MAVSQKHLDALMGAYALGATEVSYDGRVTKYRTMADLAEAIAAVARILGVTNPLNASVVNPPRRVYLGFSRG